MKLTDYLAFYAAVLSSIVFIWNLIQSRPRIRVRLVTATESKNDVFQFGVYICIQNLSSHAVNISHVSLLYETSGSGFLSRLRHLIKYRRISRRVGWCSSSLSNYGIEDKCPYKVEARDALNIFVPDEAVKSLLSTAKSDNIMAVAQDQLWIDRYSNRLKYRF